MNFNGNNGNNGNNDNNNNKKEFNEKINFDVATAEEIKRANEKLSEYIRSTGNEKAADQIDYLIENQKTEEITKEIQPKTNSFKLFTINKKILAVLERIQRDMIDEQDTTIKNLPIAKSKKNFICNKLFGEKNKKDEKVDDISSDSSDSSDLSLYFPKKFKKVGKGGAGMPSSGGKRVAKKPRKISNILNKFKKYGKNILRFGRFAGPLGIAIASGLFIADSIKGYNSADEILGIDKNKLTVGNKVASAIGSLISGLTFGVVDKTNVSKGINNLIVGNENIKKYESKGIIDYNTIGNSRIVDYNKLGKLTPKEIQEIIDIGDWSDYDLEILKGVKKGLENNLENRLKVEQNIELPVKEPVKISPEIKETETPKRIKKISSYSRWVRIGSRNPIGALDDTVSNNLDNYKLSDLFTLYKIDESDFDGVEKNMLRNLKAMAAEYKIIYGEKIQINSAYRSFKEQEKLRKKYGEKAASPGQSMHNYGLAIDMNTENVRKALKAGLFAKYGFTNPVPGETWHIEPKWIDRDAVRKKGMEKYAKEIKKVTQMKLIPQTIKEKGESEKTSFSRYSRRQEYPTKVPNNINVNGLRIDNSISSNIRDMPKYWKNYDNSDKVYGKYTIPESSKIIKEKIVDETNKNFVKNSSNRNITPEQIEKIIAPFITKNINTVQQIHKNNEQISAFSAFSSGV